MTASSKDNTVCVLLNRGDGGFAPKRDFAIASAGLYVTTEIADVNGDNRPDIVTENVNFGPNSSLTVFAFAPPQRR